MEKNKLKFFGTDGFRFETEKINTEQIYFLSSLEDGLKKISNKNKINILIGNDTRKSSSNIYNIIKNNSNNFEYVEIISSPSISYISKKTKTDYGIIITASHNPHYFNGIKIFNSKGDKLSKKEELKIEKNYFENKKKYEKKIKLLEEIINLNNRNKKIEKNEKIIKKRKEIKRIKEIKNNNLKLKNIYINNLYKSFKKIKYDGKIIFDLANGSNSGIVPNLMKKMNLDYQLINSSNKLTNKINLNCGSENTRNLEEIIKKTNANIGFAFDGDADRIVVVDENANKISGDKILGFLAIYEKDLNQLNKSTLVITENSNMNLKKYLLNKGIKVKITKTGDKNVFNLMKLNDYNLGGENSGHIIYSNYISSSDGLYVGMKILEALKYYNLKPSEILNDFKPYNSIKYNVKIKEKKDLKIFENELEYIENKLKNKGRILLRYSGTEPIIRILIEGDYNTNFLKKTSNKLIKKIKKEFK